MKPSLCVIDDNEMMCEFLDVYFSKDYQTSIYKSAKNALQEMQKSAFPAVILLDLNIQEFSGIDFLKAFQQNPYNDTSIIVLSSKDKSTDRIECLSLGAKDYLVKPFHPKELALRIKRLTKA